MRDKREQEMYLRSLYYDYTPEKHDEFVAKYYEECEEGKRRMECSEKSDQKLSR
uniref:Uncharacterized protein n=1 Tax=viral metagenome TaxID=1070528 RepID=A0A6M3JHT2_9ZZZZ